MESDLTGLSLRSVTLQVMDLRNQSALHNGNVMKNDENGMDVLCYHPTNYGKLIHVANAKFRSGFTLS